MGNPHRNCEGLITMNLGPLHMFHRPELIVLALETEVNKLFRSSYPWQEETEEPGVQGQPHLHREPETTWTTRDSVSENKKLKLKGKN